jgi:hypothetical protein
LTLLAEHGPQLEKYNDFRDKFIEHAHPLRGIRQPRPASANSVLRFHEPRNGELLSVDQILDTGPGWVRLEAISSSHRKYHVVRAHVMLVSDATAGSPRIEPDPTMTGHFRNTDPHEHQYMENSDEMADGVLDQGLSVVSSSDLSEVQGAVIRYAHDLIQECATR